MWWLTLLTALADDGAYRACCAWLEGGLCPTYVEVFGPGTLVGTPPEGGDVRGVWALTCADGAAWFPAAPRVAPPAAQPGDVLTPLGDVASACFAAACNLPARLCMARVDGVTRVLACDTGQPADHDAWTDTRLAPTTAVIAGRRVVRAQEVPADRDRVAPVQVVRAPTPAPTSPPAGSAPPPAPAPTPAPAAASPAAATAPAGPGDRVAAVARVPATPPVDDSLPPLPPDPCVVQGPLRQASIDQVELGDEAAIRGDVARALGHYRTAITINACNPYAWAQLGTTLLDADRIDRAITSLETATRLMPEHFRAWTDLGRAREERGAFVSAIEAYQEALTLRPGYVPAEAGLRRSIRSR